uniref:Glycosyltransferase family 92 protein n=1 Tax=Setaria digitata TaxID=48799 RepID=A0A915Q641_9BILA
MKRGRFRVRPCFPHARLFLQFFFGVLLISLSITALLLSTSLFLLRGHGSRSLPELYDDSTDAEEDGFSCKLRGKFSDFIPEQTTLTLILPFIRAFGNLLNSESNCALFLKLSSTNHNNSLVTDLPRAEKFTVQNLTSRSLIITRSVLFQQRSGLYLKILFLKRCETDVSDVRLQVDSKILCPAIKHIESDHCPWDWAPKCAWSSFIATARLDFTPSHILFNFDSHVIELRFESSHNIKNLLFAVCTQPLYCGYVRDGFPVMQLSLVKIARSEVDIGFSIVIVVQESVTLGYVDWLKIIEFIEIWTSQGANHFFFYVYTVSQLVMDVLQYYEMKGTVTLLPWKSFPVGENENPNRDVYRLAHSLANNDCLWRAQSARFVAFVDLDEYILTMSGVPLASFIEKKANLCPHCGSFAAIHRKMYYVSLRPQDDFHWYDIKFEWLTNIGYGLPEADGPHKQIVRPETVSIISTHSTRKSYHGYVDVNLNSSEVALLHASYKWSESSPPVNIVYTAAHFVNTLVSLKKAYHEVAGSLFRNKTLKNNKILQIEIDKCINRWHVNKCKVIDMCKARVNDDSQLKWIYGDNFNNDKYQFV